MVEESIAKPESGCPRGPFQRAGAALSDIKVAHSVFALPFAILAAFLATPAARGDAGASGWRRFAGQLGLVVVCMVLARTWAMLVNRLADREFDAANPRTAGRAVASGRAGVRDAAVVAGASAAGFVACCAGFWGLFGNPWPLILSAPTLAWIGLYSFTKRFTALCHVFLGGALAASPLAAAIAVEPSTLGMVPGTESGTGLALWLLAGMVVFWVGGFDIAYALQDVQFDRETGLSSIPARLGPRRAIVVSRVFHAAAWGLLAGAWYVEPRLGVVFGVAVAGVAALLAYEHVVLARRGVAGLPIAFFTVNGVVSVLLGAAGVVDVLV